MQIRSGSTRKRLLNALVLICALVVIAVIASGYLRVMQAEEQERVNQVVRESAIQSVALIRERLTNDMARIEEMAFYLGQHTISISSPKVLRAMQSFNGGTHAFRTITTATPDGTLYGVDGHVLGDISQHKHFRVALSGRTTISELEQPVGDHRLSLCITAPIKRKGEIIGIVNGQYSMSSLTEFLSTESFGGRGYSYMASAEGEIFARSNSPYADPHFTNIYVSFQSTSAVSAATLAQMRKNMHNGESGWVSYNWNGSKRTLHYLPLGINDWYFLSVLPNEIVASRTNLLAQESFIFTGALLSVLLLLIFYINETRRKTQAALSSVHEELLTIYNTIPGGVFKCRMDEGFTLIGANDGFYRVIGYSREALKAQFSNQLISLMAAEDVAHVRKILSLQLQSGGSASAELHLVRADGSVRWLLICGEILRAADGNALVYCSFTDITELKQTQEALRDAKQRYDLIMAETQDVLFEWDIAAQTVRHSKIFEKKFGYACNLENFPQSILLQHLVPAEDEERCLAIYQRIEAGNHFSSGEFRIKKADGSFLWCRVSITAVPDSENHLRRAVGIITDIDHVKQELQAITEKSQRDSMTGLYNKATTEQLIEQRLHAPLALAALLTVDLDNFKDVNDTLGHASGDIALIEVSQQLQRMFRCTDIVGRVGGDEFMVFVEGLGAGDNLEQKLAEISTLFNWSFCKRDLEYSISCSIGVALFPQDGESCAELSAKADAALYFAKQHGKNQFAIYDETMQSSIHGVETAQPDSQRP